MVFDSFFFIFIFLPILLVGWFELNRVSGRAAELFLIGMSLWFYGCFGAACLAVLLVSIAVNYLFGRFVTGHRFRLAAGIAANLLLLSWFKYGTPFISTAMSDAESLPTFLTLSLPVGLSFYTFTQIAYLIDRYRGSIPQDSFLSYVLYASYFPKLSEGPITCYEEIMSQLRDPSLRKVNAENIARGFILFFLGMGKKLLIADTLAPAATHGFASAYYLDTLSVIVTLCCYALQLYFDFSGFCDMAMGVSMMLNIRLPLNFNAPFRVASFSDFWKRWHMTLTRFFTRNVYIPLGGSRQGRVRTWINVMIVFLLSAAWHGTGLTYIAWGVLTGVLVILSRQRQQAGRQNLPAPLLRVLNFALFGLTLIFFGAPNLTYSAVMFRALFIPRFPGWLYRMAGQVDVAEFWLVNKAVSQLAPALSDPAALSELLLVLLIAFVLVFQRKTAMQLSESIPLTAKSALLTGLLAFWCMASMSGVSTYLYFQF